jgi:hypothetical protein
VRTTLTLDDDVANLLNKEIRRSGVSLKEGLNHFLRIGLMASKRQIRKPFTVTPRPLGLPPGLSYDNIEELLESIEGDSYR